MFLFCRAVLLDQPLMLSQSRFVATYQRMVKRFSFRNVTILKFHKALKPVTLLGYNPIMFHFLDKRPFMSKYPFGVNQPNVIDREASFF